MKELVRVVRLGICYAIPDLPDSLNTKTSFMQPSRCGQSMSQKVQSFQGFIFVPQSSGNFLWKFFSIQSRIVGLLWLASVASPYGVHGIPSNGGTTDKWMPLERDHLDAQLAACFLAVLG